MTEGVFAEEVRRSDTAPDTRRWYALAVLCTAMFMVILDGTIVYTALPSIEHDLGFTAGGVQWVMSAYLLSLGGLLLLGGRSADLLGRRRMFMIGIALFVLSSFLCGLAWSDDILIAARIVQGVSAAIMTPTALSILTTTFDDGPERNKALAIWSAIGGVGATGGLLFGGPVTDGLGWEWIFFINIPIGLALLAVSPLVLRESRDRESPRSFDLAGAVTITAALVLLVYAIAEAPAAGWTGARTIGLFVASAALVALFVVIESRSSAPLVPLRIFRSRTLLGGNLVLLAAGMSVDGMLFVVTLYAQQVLGYSAVQFGLMTAVMTVMSVVGAFAAQYVVTKTGGFRLVAAVSMAVIAASCLLLTGISADGGYFGDLFFGLLIFGGGLGAAFVAASIAALTGVADQESGLASGLQNTSFHIGGAVGIAVVATIAVSQAHGSETPAALTEGFSSALVATVVFAVLGLLAAVIPAVGRRGAQR